MARGRTIVVARARDVIVVSLEMNVSVARDHYRCALIAVAPRTLTDSVSLASNAC